MNNLRSVDLNLLVVLEALLAERHVSRAASRLAMSQPAVSHALHRLRDLFDDPLLVRSPHGLVPSARALALLGPLSDALNAVRSMVHESAFDPAAARETFRLAMSDYGAALLLPRLLACLRREAPGIELVVTQASREDMLRQTLEGELDLAIGVFPSLPDALRTSLLVQEHFMCIADRAHPALRKGKLSLEAYLDAPHMLISVRGEPVGEIEHALAVLGRKRTVKAIVPHFLPAPELVLGTDLLLTLPSRSLLRYRGDGRFAIAEPPFEVAPYAFVQAWHVRNDAEPAQRWLREKLEQVARAHA